MNALILIGLLVLASCTSNEAFAMGLPDGSNPGPYFDYNGQPRGSYESQQETYRRQNYDTQQYGPLPERLRDEQRRHEREQGWQDQGNSQDYYGRSQGDNGGQRSRR